MTANDLRLVIYVKGQKRFHSHACRPNLEELEPGPMTERGALRRALELCPSCSAIDLEELEVEEDLEA